MHKLRPYQIEDLVKLVKLKAAGIFNEQRTGKTATAISYAKYKKLTKALIVCPKSAIPVWRKELKIWYPEIKITTLDKDSTKNRNLIRTDWTEFLIISYDTLKSTEKRDGMASLILQTKSLELCIIDEAHRIQTRSSATNKAVQLFNKTPHKLAITGTPANNKPEQIFPILKFLYPKIFTSFWNYIETYYNTILEYNRASKKEYTVITGFKSEKAKIEHARMLNMISVQRKRSSLMEWLPEKNYFYVPLECNTLQKNALDMLETYFEYEHIVVEGTLDRLVRYRQICTSPYILNIGRKKDSPKTDWIINFIKDYPENKILIFSKFTPFIHLIKELIELNIKGITVEVYEGATKISERERIVQDFQNSKINVLILQIDAAKESICLDNASTIIFADRYPPIGDIQQAEDRFVATSKEKKDLGHDIYILYMQETYEEQLNSLIGERATQTSIVNNFAQYLEGKNT